jgi:type I phosphodiesterase/nucleotide pyrophosphatase
MILLGLLVLLSLSACATPAAKQTAAPDHLMILVFDQMRADYIDRFGLENFKRLRASSRNYPEAYVGHLGSQTVVSHLVISTGLLPKSLPWQDDTLVDETGTLGKPGAVYETTSLTLKQFWQLLTRIPTEQFLASRIRDKFGGKVFAVGEKNYAAEVFGTPAADAIITLTKASGRCTPDGINVPAYISSNARYSLECSEAYGTGFSTIYSLDGSRYVPGHDSAHLGGDVWTADAAIEIMARENWSGLLLTFGGIDRIAHMLGEQDGHGLTSVSSEYHLSDALRIADGQLGRLLDALDEHKLTDRTLIVLTADHGGQKDEFYLGNNKYQSCCPFENSEAKVEPPYWIEHLNQIGKLKAGYADTSVKLWLADRSAANEQAIVRGMADISGMTEVYALRHSGEELGRFRYEQVFSRLDSQSARFRDWARRHSAELLATMACESAPHLVGLLADGFGFGKIGDHGGTQEKVQRIPMIIHVPGEPPATLGQPLRLVDVSSEITGILDLKAAPRSVEPPR